MNYSTAKDRYYDLIKLQNETNFEYKDAVRNNEKLQDIDSKVEDFSEAISKINKFKKDLSLSVDKINNEYNRYKTNRISFLTAYIQEIIDTVFPLRGFIVKLNPDLRYKIPRVDLTVTNSFGIEINIRISEGGLFKQLVSYGAASSLVQSIENGKLFLDEAFFAGSPENLSKVYPVIQALIDKGIQVFIIEQTDTVYKDLHRREYILDYDEINKSTILRNVSNY